MAISCGASYTVGLKSDGTVVVVGDDSFGQCDVGSWKLYNNINTIDEDIEERKTKLLEDLQNKKSELMNELTNLKGIFSGMRRKKIEEELEQIEKQIKNMNSTI